MAGINRNYVGQIEREEKSPTIDLLERLVVALDVEPEVFFLKSKR